MSGALRRFGEYLGLLEDTGRYDEHTGEYFPDEEETLAPLRSGRRLASAEGSDYPPSQRTSASVSDISERRRVASAPEPVSEVRRITTVDPSTYNEARIVGEHFRDGTPVIMNLTEMDDADAKRLVDFAAGLVFATRGSIERVTNKVFLLCPPNVSVAAEEKERIAEGGFFNQS